MRYVLISLATFAVLAVTTTLLRAGETLCADTAEARRVLAEKYGERPESAGIDPAGMLVEMWGNEETGTWTLMATEAGGETCILAAGNGFVRAAPADKESF